MIASVPESYLIHRKRSPFSTVEKEKEYISTPLAVRRGVGGEVSNLIHRKRSPFSTVEKEKEYISTPLAVRRGVGGEVFTHRYYPF